MTGKSETANAVPSDQQQPLDDETFKSFFQKDNSNKTKKIESIEQFEGFKDDFLKKVRPYLNPTGTATAREADEALCQELETLAKACLATKTMAKEGKIGPDSTTVKGKASISEMTDAMKSCEQSVDKYLPKTSTQEKKAGYTKFELASVLIKDGFRAYGLMAATRDYAAGMVSEGGALSEVLNDGQLTIAMYYFTALEAFCETMADLGLYEVMEQLTELYKIRPRARKMKKKKFDRNAGRDALSDSEHEKGYTKPDDDEDEEEGPMFQNRIKDRPANQKQRAIIDKGWSLGFAPGEEIKDPTRKPKKTKKKKTKGGKPKSLRSKGDGGDAASVDTADSSDGADPNDDPAASKSSKPKDGGSGGPSSDDKEGTETTDEDEDDGESSSEEEEEDDEDDDYIYYFDPVQQIVGKLPRTACAAEKLILLSPNPDLPPSKDTHDGIVEDWDTKDEENPGKTELILTMKEVLRGKATDKVDGLQD